MQTRATLALLLPCIWTIYKLKNTDFLFCSCGVIPPPTPPAQNVFAPLRSAFQHSATQTRISPHIANMARTIKAVLKTFSHELENKSQKSKTEKIHKKTGK